MSKNVDFEIGTIVTDSFLDGVQELLTGTSQNIRLAESTLGTDRITVALSGDTMFDQRGAVNIEGNYCFLDVAQDSSPASSGSGSRNVYLSTTVNGTPQQPNFNITVDSSPPADSYLKRIGIVDKTVSQLSNARMITGVQADYEQYNAFTFRSVYNLDGETLLTLRGRTNQTSPYGTYIMDVSPTPTTALSVGTEFIADTYSERMYIDTEGRIVWTNSGVPAEYVNLIGGTDPDDATPHLYSNATIDSRPPDFEWAFGTRLTLAGDTNHRVAIGSDGEICWGDGTLAPDVCIMRTGVDQLSLDTGDQLFMDYTILAGDSPDIVANKEYVDAEVGAITSSSRRFSFFIGS